MDLDDLFRRPAALTRFRMPPVGTEMDGFSQWLCGNGFSRHVLRRYVWQVSHFNQYLRRLRVKDCQEVQRSHGERFIRKHLPRCRCGGAPRRLHVGAPRSVRSFMDYLSERDLLAVPSETPPPHERVLQEFLDYSKYERNLAERTIEKHRRYLVPFLEHLGADATGKRLSKLSPEKVQAFFAEDIQDIGRTVRQHVQGTLRTFFRFCVKQGYLKRDLAQAVPRIRTYRLSHVPRGVSDEDGQKVLDSIDRTTPVGRRDFAIIQLLHTYGVRGGQLRVLQLQDIHWRQNRIRFPALKGGKEVVEPLTDEVGESVLEYLRHGRPDAVYPEVFLTARPPYQPLRTPCTVSMIVAQRMRQAGVSSSPKGSHAFRHAFATRMLKGGQSLKTIADMLGHQHINTTFIYTKVDLETLRQLPLSWPEVSS